MTILTVTPELYNLSKESCIVSLLNNSILAASPATFAFELQPNFNPSDGQILSITILGIPHLFTYKLIPSQTNPYELPLRQALSFIDYRNLLIASLQANQNFIKNLEIQGTHDGFLISNIFLDKKLKIGRASCRERVLNLV